jgi:hypothetical protein
VVGEQVKPWLLNTERHSALLKLKARVGEGLRGEGFALKLCEDTLHAHLVRRAPRKELNVVRSKTLGERSVELKGEARGAPERGDLPSRLTRLIRAWAKPQRVPERAPALMREPHALT